MHVDSKTQARQNEVEKGEHLSFGKESERINIKAFVLELMDTIIILSLQFFSEGKQRNSRLGSILQIFNT